VSDKDFVKIAALVLLAVAAAVAAIGVCMGVEELRETNRELRRTGDLLQLDFLARAEQEKNRLAEAGKK
jgi:hypothetical protein